jgi:hypothetical protein
MIDVESEKGVGSRFFFKFKVSEIEEPFEIEGISPLV